jgi:hypothetical protein
VTGAKMGVNRRLILLSPILGLSFPGFARAEYALRDGDTVVFLGDSNTAARTYGKIVENYTLLRFPDRRVRFINAGWGGDTAAGGLERLGRDVFAQAATVLVVAYGINDIGWGTKADAEHKKVYLEAIGEIIARCKQRGVRVFICSAAITAESPETSEGGFLQSMCDEAMTIARSMGEGAKVTGLPESAYEVRVDGRALGSFAADRLATGINLSIGDCQRVGARRSLGRAGLHPDRSHRGPQQGCDRTQDHRPILARPSQRRRLAKAGRGNQRPDRIPPAHRGASPSVPLRRATRRTVKSRTGRDETWGYPKKGSL